MVRHLPLGCQIACSLGLVLFLSALAGVMIMVLASPQTLKG